MQQDKAMGGSDKEERKYTRHRARINIRFEITAGESAEKKKVDRQMQC